MRLLRKRDIIIKEFPNNVIPTQEEVEDLKKL